MHDRIVVALFYHVIEKSRHIRKQGEQYVLSREGQAELQQEALRMIRDETHGMSAPMPDARVLGCEMLWRPPALLLALAKYLFPKDPSP